MNEIKEYRRPRQRGFNAHDYYIEPRWGIGDKIPNVKGKERDYVIESISISINERGIGILYGFACGFSAFEEDCFLNQQEYLEAKRERLITDHQTELARIDEEIKELKFNDIRNSAKPTD